MQHMQLHPSRVTYQLIITPRESFVNNKSGLRSARVLLTTNLIAVARIRTHHDRFPINGEFDCARPVSNYESARYESRVRFLVNSFTAIAAASRRNVGFIGFALLKSRINRDRRFLDRMIPAFASLLAAAAIIPTAFPSLLSLSLSVSLSLVRQRFHLSTMIARLSRRSRDGYFCPALFRRGEPSVSERP